MCSKIKNKHKMLLFDFLHLNITLKWPSFGHSTETSMLRLLCDESLDDFTPSDNEIMSPDDLPQRSAFLDITTESRSAESHVTSL